jgi:hypothetical protein
MHRSIKGRSGEPSVNLGDLNKAEPNPFEVALVSPQHSFAPQSTVSIIVDKASNRQ